MPIGAVVERLQASYPDISHSSLRFLEREGLIAAHRTPGGHRLYSPGDVDRILQIKQWQAQRLSLEEIRQRLARLDDLPPLATLSDTFLSQVLAGDLPGAAQTVLSADDIGLPLVQTFGKVLQPALVEVGHRWANAELLVAQEKEFSELTRDLIAELTLRHAHPRPAGPSVVAACVAGERHELGLRMIAGLLREQGYPVHYLGADVDARFLAEAVELHRPALVLLSVKIRENLPAIAAAVQHLSSLPAPQPLPTIIAGGQATAGHPEAVRAAGAVPLVDQDLEQVLAAITTMLGPPTTSTRTTP